MSREHAHAGDITPPSRSEQMDGTMFEGLPLSLHARLGQVPAASYAVDTSQAAADALSESGELAENRFAVLQRLAKSPATGPQIIQEWDCDSNHVAPRMTELRNTYLLIERTGAKAAVKGGKAAHIHRLTELGWRILHEQQARRITAGGSFGPERKPAA